MKAVPKNKFEISELPQREGGGFLVVFPELPGCMSDGATVEEAVFNAADAEQEWLLASKEWEVEGKPAKIIARMPRWMYKGLQRSAQSEGVSVNTFVISILAKNLGAVDIAYGVKKLAK